MEGHPAFGAATGSVFIEEKSSPEGRVLFAMNVGTERLDFGVPEALDLTDALRGERFRGASTGTVFPMEGLSARFLRIDEGPGA